MPSLRGIDVYLATKPDKERIPEYPRPEGTSTRDRSEPQARTRGDGGCTQLRADPTVAVYVPSVPGTRFALHYCIRSPPPAPCKFLFFRLYINGRPLAAWGIDPTSRPRGQVVQSLWAPGGIYEGMDGFESRNFVFLPGDNVKSIAEDGGVIEVRAFRAKDRRARAPKLESFRYQQNYGISTPSMGLLDQPPMACFYDWHLLDPKDSPLATFRFHHRSLKSLQQLNLISEKEIWLLRATGPKILRGIAEALCYGRHVDAGWKMSGWPPTRISTNAADAQKQPGNPETRPRVTPRTEPAARPNVPSFAFLKSPPELFPAVAEPSNKLPQPGKALRDACRHEYQQRPLPGRPLPGLPMEIPATGVDNRSKRLSTASATSTAGSITSSLLESIEEDTSDFDYVEIGVARVVRISKSAAAGRVEQKRREARGGEEMTSGGTVLS
ncbi:hypothetical protein VTJ83DRAFT_5812 [Remersonia thermophila]|uniref:Uncharacterized protein n=1 Tax=Remersonia thermophila TaxID=72144 RepID=A0ABR4D8P0_9PEZI